MKKKLLILAGTLSIVGAAHAADGPAYVLQLMKDVVAPQAQILWDVGNKAYNDDGNVVASRLSAGDWTNLGTAAQAMKGVAVAMAQPGIKVAPEGTRMQDEGQPNVATARQIQGFIDADPEGFKAHADALADVSDAFVKASQTRDAQTLADASAKLDEVCEACHVKYWYPQ